MRLNIHELGCDLYSASPHKWLQAPKGSGFLYVRDEVIDRLWNTIATEGWDDTKIRAERFSASAVPTYPRSGACAPPSNWPMTSAWTASSAATASSAITCSTEMQKRGADSWTSPDPALRCAIVTVNVPAGPPRMDLENWLWNTHKIRIRGGDPSKLRLSTPYYFQKNDIDRFLDQFDAYKKTKGIA